jgi:hypothetical protein
LVGFELIRHLLRPDDDRLSRNLAATSRIDPYRRDKIEAGKLELNPEPVNLARLIAPA